MLGPYFQGAPLSGRNVKKTIVCLQLRGLTVDRLTSWGKLTLRIKHPK
jgi:hypothetical protein